jgi:hypothetical protein
MHITVIFAAATYARTMDDILNMTVIPGIKETYESLRYRGEAADEGRAIDDDDRLAIEYWMNRERNGNSEVDRVYRRVLSFLSCSDRSRSSPYEALVDEERLEALGLDPEYVGAFLRYKKRTDNDDLRTVIYMAFFLNTFGVTDDVLSAATMRFYDDKIGRFSRWQQRRGRGGGGEEDDAWRKYDDVSENLNKNDLQSMCCVAMKAHFDEKEVADVIRDKRDVVTDRIKNVLGAGLFTAETLITEIFHQILLPRHARKCFLETLSNCRELPADAFVVDGIENAMRGKDISLASRLPSMTDELLEIVLPPRFHIKNGTSVATLDVFVDVLMGASTKFKCDLYDIVTFVRFKSLSDTDSILDAMTSSPPSYRDGMLRDWAKQATFVVWAEIARRTLGNLVNWKITGVDHFPAAAAGSLPERHLCYFNGRYYGRESGPTTYCSTDYRVLIDGLWRLTSCQL